MEEEGNNLKGEEAFRNTMMLPWTEQITVRSVVTSFVLSIVFIFIVCKLNFTTGIIPSLNVAAGLLGFAAIKAYTALLNNCGLLKQPFTRQENTVIQTFVVASSGIAFSSEFFFSSSCLPFLSFFSFFFFVKKYGYFSKLTYIYIR